MTKSTLEANALEFVQHLGKGNLPDPARKADALVQGFCLQPRPGCQVLWGPGIAGKQSFTPSFLSFVKFSAFFAIRGEVTSEDTVICNIWKKIKSLLFIKTALLLAKSLWYNLDNEISTACVSMSIQKSSHQSLALLEKKKKRPYITL